MWMLEGATASLYFLKENHDVGNRSGANSMYLDTFLCDPLKTLMIKESYFAPSMHLA
jgi:hypothetical protein